MITWIELYYACYSRRELGEISDFQREKLPDIEAVADVQRAINYRFKKHREEKAPKKETTKARKASVNRRTAPHATYIAVAAYYEKFYLNGCKLAKNLQPPVHTFQDYVDHIRTQKTKHVNYIHKRSDEIIQELRQSRRIMRDDEFIVAIYNKSPKHAFSKEERDAWSEMYRFATTEVIDFRFVNRTNRRAVHTNTGTFREIAEEYREEFELYSCKERFFIPLFTKSYKKLKTTQLERLIRYGSDRECFSEADLAYISEKVGDTFDVDDFFYTLEVIRKMSQKKQP